MANITDKAGADKIRLYLKNNTSSYLAANIEANEFGIETNTHKVGYKDSAGTYRSIPLASELALYLPLTGGTMTGDIEMEDEHLKLSLSANKGGDVYAENDGTNDTLVLEGKSDGSQAVVVRVTDTADASYDVMKMFKTSVDFFQDLRGFSGATQKMAFDVGNGALGIGATAVAPSAPLHVSNGAFGGTMTSGSEVFIEDDDNVVIQLACPDNKDIAICMGDATDPDGNKLVIDQGTGWKIFVEGSEKINIGATYLDMDINLRMRDNYTEFFGNDNDWAILFDTIGGSFYGYAGLCITSYANDAQLHIGSRTYKNSVSIHSAGAVTGDKGLLDLYGMGCPAQPWFQFRHSAVAHGMTDIMPTDVVGKWSMISSTCGGVQLTVANDPAGADDIFKVLSINAATFGTEANFVWDSSIKDGTNDKAVGATGVMTSWRNNGTEKMRMYGDGGIEYCYDVAARIAIVKMDDGAGKYCIGNAQRVRFDGAVSRGNICCASTVSGRVKKCAADDSMPIGFAIQDYSDGDYGWIIYSGYAWGKFKSGVIPTAGYVAFVSNSAGELDCASSVPAAATHDREVGHINTTGSDGGLALLHVHFR